MHKDLYNRIVTYARDIESGKSLPRFNKPWQADGLETARQVYNEIKNSNGQTAEEIANKLEISKGYAKQAILAMQNGGANIKAIARQSKDQHRHEHEDLTGS